MKKSLVVGVLMCLVVLVGMVSATPKKIDWTVNFDWNVVGGEVVAETEVDGGYAFLHGVGKQLSGSFKASDDYYYDYFLDAWVYARGVGAKYEFKGWQKVVRPSSDYLAKVGAKVYGTKDVFMNLLFDQDAYVIQLERQNTREPLLMASGEQYELGLVTAHRQGDELTAEYGIEVLGVNGEVLITTDKWYRTAEFHYHFGNKPNDLHVPDMGYNHIKATGAGTVTEFGFGANYLKWNNVEMPNGGQFLFMGNYNNGFAEDVKAVFW